MSFFARCESLKLPIKRFHNKYKFEHLRDHVSLVWGCVVSSLAETGWF